MTSNINKDFQDTYQAAKEVIGKANDILQKHAEKRQVTAEVLHQVVKILDTIDEIIRQYEPKQRRIENYQEHINLLLDESRKLGRRVLDKASEDIEKEQRNTLHKEIKIIDNDLKNIESQAI